MNQNYDFSICQSICSYSSHLYGFPNGNHRMDWKGNKYANLNCYVCGCIVQSAHNDGCPNAGKIDDDNMTCSCCVRKKNIMIPICKKCHIDNLTLIHYLFNEKQSSNGMLFRLTSPSPTNLYVLYSTLEGYTNKVKDDTILRNTISTDSIKTDLDKNTCESPSLELINLHLLQGYDVTKVEYWFCSSCRLINEYKCEYFQDHRGTHEEHICQCLNCNNISLVKIKFWALNYTLIDQKTISINRTIEDTHDIFSDKSCYFPLNDFRRKRKNWEHDKKMYPEHWFSSFKDIKSIYMSVLGIHKAFKQGNCDKLVIESSQQNVDIIAEGFNLVRGINYQSKIFRPIVNYRQITPVSVEKIHQMDESLNNNSVKKNKIDFNCSGKNTPTIYMEDDGPIEV